MDKPGYYAVIPAEVRYSPDLRPAAKLLYAEITALANKRGFCTAQNAYFASLFDASKKTVESWISELSKADFIRVEVVRNGGRCVVERRIWIVRPIPDPPLEIEGTSPKNIGDPPLEIEGDIKENITRANNTPIVPKGDKPAPGNPAPSELDPKEVGKLYVSLCGHLTGFIKLSPGRERAIAKLSKSGITIEQVAEAFARADASDFLRGLGSRGWRASFDWLIREDNLLKVLEGKFDNPEPTHMPAPGGLIEEAWVDA